MDHSHRSPVMECAGTRRREPHRRRARRQTLRDPSDKGRNPLDRLLGAPILSSPAIDEKLARVYVGCENMHVYAFELATGRQLWNSEKLPGVSFRGYHPVVAPD